MIAISMIIADINKKTCSLFVIIFFADMKTKAGSNPKTKSGVKVSSPVTPSMAGMYVPYPNRHWGYGSSKNKSPIKDPNPCTRLRFFE